MVKSVRAPENACVRTVATWTKRKVAESPMAIFMANLSTGTVNSHIRSIIVSMRHYRANTLKLYIGVNGILEGIFC